MEFDDNDVFPVDVESRRPAQIRPTHLQRRAVVYLRQSSDDQVRDHSGSTDAQLDQAEFARRWGWPESQIVINKKDRSEEHTSELQSPCNLVCRLLLEKKK